MSASSSKIVTFGCRLNALESEEMSRWVEKTQGIIVVNTCAVTAEAERQARQKIRQLKRQNPQVKIIVTGCSAALHAEIYKQMPEVDHVLANHEKMHPARTSLPFLEGTELPVLNNITGCQPTRMAPIAATPTGRDLTGIEATGTAPIAAVSKKASSMGARAKAFLPIQTGCNHHCSFCVVHIVRGPSVSFPFHSLVEQAKALAQNGFQEINVTGIDLASYKDGERRLWHLLQALLDSLPPSVCLRLSSLDPAGISEELLPVLANKRLLPYCHLSMQSGDPTLLARMLRRHTPQDILSLSQNLRAFRPDILLGADVIAGFPGETEDMFQNTYHCLQQCRIALLHVFPYSDRPGTAACLMKPKIPLKEKKERAKRLRDLGRSILHEEMQAKLGQNVRVLLEKRKGHSVWGKTEHFLPVRIENLAENDVIRTFVTVTLTDLACEAASLASPDKLIFVGKAL